MVAGAQSQGSDAHAQDSQETKQYHLAGFEHADSIARLKQAPLAVPIQAASTSRFGSAPLQLSSSLAAEHALQLSTRAAASPEQQRVWLRAFLFKQLRSPDANGAIQAHWPEPPAFELRGTQGGLREGSKAKRLFRRMGSTPAAAALLRSLICPLTKVVLLCFEGMPLSSLGSSAI